MPRRTSGNNALPTNSRDSAIPGDKKRFGGIRIAIIVAVAVIVATVAVGVAVWPDAGSDTAGAEDPGPIDISTLPAGTAELYRFVESQPDLFRTISCYCGCEQFLDHRDLYDCFVRAGGTGHEAHASACAVCTSEASVAQAMLAEGQDPATIHDAIDDDYGTTIPTTAPQS